MTLQAKSEQDKNNKPKPVEKKKYEISEKDNSWFWDRYDALVSQSPILSAFLDPQEPYSNLVNSISEAILTKTTPKVVGFETSIIAEQLDDETEQWSILFSDVFLKQSPSFIFANASTDQAYLSIKSKEFLDWLYSPLRIQYAALINNSITYNYSPYSIPLNIFKNKNKQ